LGSPEKHIPDLPRRLQNDFRFPEEVNPDWIWEAFRYQEYEEVYRFARYVGRGARYEFVPELFRIGESWVEMGATRENGHLLANLAVLLHPKMWCHTCTWGPDSPEGVCSECLNPFELYVAGVKAWWPEGNRIWIERANLDRIDRAAILFAIGYPQRQILLTNVEKSGYMHIASTGAWKVGERCPDLRQVPRCVCEEEDDVFRDHAVDGLDDRGRVTYKTICTRCGKDLVG
jgi:hypothetical protein